MLWSDLLEIAKSYNKEYILAIIFNNIKHNYYTYLKNVNVKTVTLMAMREIDTPT